jgi:hypothetical protein
VFFYFTTPSEMWSSHWSAETLVSLSTGEYIRSLLQERGLSLLSINDFERSEVRSRIRGHYRRIFQYPEAFTYQTIQQTEINALQLHPRDDSVSAAATEAQEAKRLALVIEFNLSPGSYATMLLRELMKEATDSSYHAELTAATAAADVTSRDGAAVGEKRRSDDLSGTELESVTKRPAREGPNGETITG